MKLEQINIRDPYILPVDGKYYLYGTRSQTCWGEGRGFDCYISENLSDWEGPIEIFDKPEGFFANKEYWAPECVKRNGRYYLFATFGSDTVVKGGYVLVSDHPEGSYKPYGKRLTPEKWDCLDGSFYEESGIPYFVFSHSFDNVCRGEMCAVALKDDLSEAAGSVIRLFDAAGAKWAVPFPYAEEEFGIKGNVYFTDGPCLKCMEDGRLYMTWSSWSVNGYAVGVAVSDNGKLAGPWRHIDEPLFPVNGGHGMFFTDYDGQMYFTLHYPNDFGKEHPVIYPVEFADGSLKLSM